MMALASMIGRDAAHHTVQDACDRALAERRPLIDVLAEDGAVATRLDRRALERLVEPGNYLGEAREIVDRVVARARRELSLVGSGGG